MGSYFDLFTTLFLFRSEIYSLPIVCLVVGPYHEYGPDGHQHNDCNGKP